MSVFKNYKTDSKLEADGVWLEFGNNESDVPVRVLVARAGPTNKAYTKALEQASRPFKRQISAGTFTSEQADKLMQDVFLDTIILDAQGLEDEKYQPLKFSKDTMRTVLQRFPDFYYDIRDEASKAANFREVQLEDDLGNFGRSSSTAGNKDKSSEK